MTTQIQHVRYRNLGWDTAAELYLPPDFELNRPYFNRYICGRFQ